MSDVNTSKSKPPRLTASIRGSIGAILWIAIVQYFVLLVIVRLAWTLPYSLVSNAISDLGAAKCGVFEGREVCSPWHVAADASWAVAGLCIAAGALLLFRELDPGTRSGRVGLGLIVVAGLSELVVGLNPEDVSAAHVPAALTTIFGGLIGILLLALSLARRRHYRALGIVGVAFAIVGLVSLVLLVLLVTVTPLSLFGLVERLAAYPILLWLVCAGAVVLRRRRVRAPGAAR